MCASETKAKTHMFSSLGKVVHTRRVYPRHMSPSPYDIAEQIPVGDNEGDNNATSSGVTNAGAVADTDNDTSFGDDAQFESTPTFRDVRNFICTQLDLAGSEDDFGMELLSCGNKIISLDLKVVDVYEKVWVPMQQQQQQNDGNPTRDIAVRTEFRRCQSPIV